MLSLDHLKQYQVSPKTGFLPFEPPLDRLPIQYEPWETLCFNLPSHIKSKTVGEHVAKLPLLSSKWLTSEPEFRRAFVILGFIADALLWGSEIVIDVRFHISSRIERLNAD